MSKTGRPAPRAKIVCGCTGVSACACRLLFVAFLFAAAGLSECGRSGLACFSAARKHGYANRFASCSGVADCHLFVANFALGKVLIAQDHGDFHFDPFFAAAFFALPDCAMS